MVTNYPNKFDFINTKNPVPICLSSIISFLFILTLPVKNLNLGDGTILLENIVLESGLFGYQLTMDELFSALLHSKLYLNLPSIQNEPDFPYYITSTISGFLFLITITWISIKNQVTLFSHTAILSCGGMILFHGYMENYTIPMLLIFWILALGYNKIPNNNQNNFKIVTFITLLATIAVLFHLITAYLLFSLIFLCYMLSPKKKFIPYALFCTGIALFVIGGIFTYFLFFSETRIDLTQTHVTNPPFYPLKRIISANHFKEILSCTVFSCFLPFYSLFYFGIFNRGNLKIFYKEKKNQFILWIIFGFCLHAFIFNPLLGFPADWDVMSFYWLPVAFLSYILFNNSPKEASYFIPLLLFSLIFYLSNAMVLNKPDLEKEKEKMSWIKFSQEYISERSSVLREIPPELKKYYAKMDYFLFKSEKILSIIPHKQKEIQNIISENRNYQKELKENISHINPNWQKDFLKRLTDYHHRYLELVKEK
ncbi:MAG: hypothetical protein H7A23_10820 [Leptospiraceae bacterium]|nr:hypothetical protein [Leptospiraceae bacterium]MCP5495037.1 hypothetical protein [Leptospiraceae bacterium]